MRHEVELLQKSKGALKDILSRSRAPPVATPLSSERDVEVEALRTSGAELERELLQLRAKLGRQDASSKEKMSKLREQVQSLLLTSDLTSYPPMTWRLTCSLDVRLPGGRDDPSARRLCQRASRARGGARQAMGSPPAVQIYRDGH